MDLICFMHLMNGTKDSSCRSAVLLYTLTTFEFCGQNTTGKTQEEVLMQV
jgi:hypothetical protein